MTTVNPTQYFSANAGIETHDRAFVDVNPASQNSDAQAYFGTDTTYRNMLIGPDGDSQDYTGPDVQPFSPRHGYDVLRSDMNKSDTAISRYIPAGAWEFNWGVSVGGTDSLGHFNVGYNIFIRHADNTFTSLGYYQSANVAASSGWHTGAVTTDPLTEYFLAHDETIFVEPFFWGRGRSGSQSLYFVVGTDILMVLPGLGQAKTIPTIGETDTAFVPSRQKQRATPTIGESDTIPLAGKGKTFATLGEIDTMPPMGRQRAKTFPTINEADTLFVPTRHKQRALPTIGESDTLNPPTKQKSKVVPTLGEVDTLNTPGALKSMPPRSFASLVPMRPVPLADDPSSGREGDLYWNTTLKAYRVYTGSAWVNVGGAAGGGVFGYHVDLGSEVSILEGLYGLVFGTMDIDGVLNLDGILESISEAT